MLVSLLSHDLKKERKFKTVIARPWHIERTAEEENKFGTKPHSLYHKNPGNKGWFS